MQTRRARRGVERSSREKNRVERRSVAKTRSDGLSSAIVMAMAPLPQPTSITRIPGRRHAWSACSQMISVSGLGNQCALDRRGTSVRRTRTDRECTGQALRRGAEQRRVESLTLLERQRRDRHVRRRKPDRGRSDPQEADRRPVARPPRDARLPGVLSNSPESVRQRDPPRCRSAARRPS